MIRDQQGHTLFNASQNAASHFNNALAAFNIYRGDPVAEIDAAIEAAPEFPMAYILKAHLCGLATEPALTAAAADIVRQVAAMPLSDREASHVHALQLLVAGRWTQAAHALEMHNSRYPLDILALQAGHIIDFYRASAHGLRDRMARVLPQWPADLPGYSIILGMYAFGLEEAGDYSRAEDIGRRAVELQPLDCWAHHAVAHVLEMQGRPKEGIEWMKTNERNWSGDDNFFQRHNWWHYAVYLLEIGEGRQALELYDQHLGAESGVALDLVDASAMLWRLSLAGIDVGHRWSSVADRWAPHADGHSYPFNDWHAVMANLGAGRDADVEVILDSLRRASAGMGESEEWARRYGLPLSEGFTAYWREDYSGAVEKLMGARAIVNGFGGSHAQRDIIDLTLLEAAIAGGEFHLARALANQRCAIKPNSRMNHELLKRSQRISSPLAA
jgi:tetratricopeptide (TPR) repeat protein